MIPHPGRVALAALAVLAAIVWLVGKARGHHVGELWRHHVTGETSRERQFVAALGFYVAFATVRTLTHAIHAGRGPFHNIEMGGRHIHHLVWGILLLLLVGYGWLMQVGTGVGRSSRWGGRAMALLYGVGAALTLDEFALWLNLQDVYWERQGRASIDAVILFGALLLMGLMAGPFLRAIMREARGTASDKPRHR